MFYNEYGEIHLTKSEKEDVMQLVALFKEGITRLEYGSTIGPTSIFKGWNENAEGKGYLVTGNLARIIHDIKIVDINNGVREFKTLDVINLSGYLLSYDKFMDECEETREILDAMRGDK